MGIGSFFHARRVSFLHLTLILKHRVEDRSHWLWQGTNRLENLRGNLMVVANQKVELAQPSQVDGFVGAGFSVLAHPAFHCRQAASSNQGKLVIGQVVFLIEPSRMNDGKLTVDIELKQHSLDSSKGSGTGRMAHHNLPGGSSGSRSASSTQSATIHPQEGLLGWSRIR
jgi:hypothetical protein